MVYRKSAVRRAVVLGTLVVAACQDAPTPTSPSPIAVAPQAARSPQAQARLEAIFQRTSPEVMALPGTVFIDNDEVAGRVVVGVEHAAAARGVEMALSRLGVAQADYAIEITKPIVFAATLRDKFDPTQGGIQIHFSRYVCTLGFNVDHAGGYSFITNSHCTTTQGGTEGTLYYQPARTATGTPIATEAADPAYEKSADCPKGKKCRHSDASRAVYASGITENRGQIAKTTGANNGSLTTAGVFTVTSQLTSTKNITGVLNKVGRTTGWTQGPVDRTCVNTSVQGSTVYLFCQTFVSAGVGSGDSGSPVFEITNGDDVRLVGILWGGFSDGKTFVMSPLASIQQELGTVNAVR